MLGILGGDGIGDRTFKPPSCADAQVFAVFGFGDLNVLLVGLRDGVVGLPGTFFD